MLRTRRYIFNTLTVVSLLLLLATVGVWVLSAFGSVGISYTTSSYQECYFRSDGYIEVGVVRFAQSAVNSFNISPGWHTIWLNDRWRCDLDDDLFDWNLLGFAVAAGTKVQFPLCRRYTVALPHWFLTVIFAIAPTIWFIKRRRQRKLAMLGKCPTCTYDLTGNQTGVCPECGAGDGRNFF